MSRLFVSFTVIGLLFGQSAWATEPALGTYEEARQLLETRTVAALSDASKPIDPKSVIDEAFLANMREWVSNPILALSINGQNDRYGALTQADIEKLDAQWRAEREANDQPLISATLSSPLSVYLLRVMGVSHGVYTEIIAMDKNGLNVGQSGITSDFWQGDEAKFQKTYGVAADAVFIDEPEFNEKTKTWRAQVNLTIVDPDSKQKIGAITVEVNLTELQRRATS